MSVRISKFLSLALRHDPGRIGIVLDDAGWTSVAALLAACAAHGVSITREELAAIVASSDKQRFALSPDGERIRANQGHSVEVDLQLSPADPPAMRLGTGDPSRGVTSAFAAARSGTGPNQLARIVLAEHTLAAVESGRYVNTRHEIVDIERSVATATARTVLHELGEPLRAPTRAEPATPSPISGNKSV